MTRPSPGGRQARPAVSVSYAAFVLLGIGAGAGGVLLPFQMAGYGVDRATIGISFFTVSAGWVLAGMSCGALIHRFGVRIVLMTGGGAYMLSGLYLATRPPFAAFVLVQVLTGYGAGVLESALNLYLTSLPSATTLLNRLHAFWGAGALLGPPLATWILGEETYARLGATKEVRDKAGLFAADAIATAITVLLPHRRAVLRPLWAIWSTGTNSGGKLIQFKQEGRPSLTRWPFLFVRCLQSCWLDEGCLSCLHL